MCVCEWNAQHEYVCVSFSTDAFLCFHKSAWFVFYSNAKTKALSLSLSFSLCASISDPGAVVETHSAVPYAVIGGILALLVFTVICVLIVTIWCSVRQKGDLFCPHTLNLHWHMPPLRTGATNQCLSSRERERVAVRLFPVPYNALSVLWD